MSYFNFVLGNKYLSLCRCFDHMHMFLVGILCLLFPNQALENIPQGEVGNSQRGGKEPKEAKLL